MEMAVATSKQDTVSSVYSDAAKAPAGLCCPQPYQSELLAHVPKAALERNYGCGSPLLKAGLKSGEVVLDLGSGVGIDCFVAAKLVGAEGKVIGVDMTDSMLEEATRFNEEVAQKLGYDVVEFRKGVIEDLPVGDNSVDLVVSNCVINLSSRKTRVLQEIHRVLKPGGRLVISDIVVDREIHPEDQDNETLWAECYTGAIPVGKLVTTYQDAGFLGLTQLSESAWRELEGYNFVSLTLRAYKLPRSSDCLYSGNLAVYLGPYESVRDEEEHEFPRFKPVEVCDATAQRLRMGPYADSFTVVRIPSLARTASTCGPGASCAPGSSCGQPATASSGNSTSCCGSTEGPPSAAIDQLKGTSSSCCETKAEPQGSSCCSGGGCDCN
ncbi:methyltransferase domain-containing protein [Aquabacterium sp. A7-Y]|uniref:methyltransferase domain-containing protein n=1 Tax=Aquabacterium sp. A7-Y TaxID=1349605 RepID=UPI00223E682D|nr:methyltransferase domain-containing protein [Aquabacterium sp. A7-Y]MCW7541002.1 methyltransferase domain-containing protein [Aquabacterium sp. A7-Y]